MGPGSGKGILGNSGRDFASLPIEPDKLLPLLSREMRVVVTLLVRDCCLLPSCPCRILGLWEHVALLSLMFAGFPDKSKVHLWCNTSVFMCVCKRVCTCKKEYEWELRGASVVEQRVKLLNAGILYWITCSRPGCCASSYLSPC